ncbi:hypothetical protein WJ968_27105 [Achromobacter xylosoxidans]
MDGSAMAYGGALSLTAGQGLTLGAALQRPAACCKPRLQADGTISGEQDPSVVQCRHRGERQDGRQWPLEHQGRHLARARTAWRKAAASCSLRRPDLRIAGTTGTAETAATGGGTLRAEACSRHFQTGTVTASSPASSSAKRHMSVDGTVTALSGDLTTRAGGDLEGGRERAFAVLGQAADAKAVAAISTSDGTLAAGGAHWRWRPRRRRLGGTIAALGTSAQARRPRPADAARPCRPAATCPCREGVT